MLRVERRPWDNFMQSCKTPKTRNNYIKDLRLFMIKYKIGFSMKELSVSDSIPIMETNCEEILKIGEQELEDTIIDYVNSIRHLSEGTIIGRLAAIQKLLDSNRVYLKWKYINSFKQSDKKIHKDEAYTREQIEEMLKYCTEPRMTCIILIFASTGIRVGAFEGLKLKHLKPIDTEKGKVYEFTIYEGSKEEYVTYCTPECSKAIDSYLDYRNRSGEELTKDSYLIVKQFNFRQSLGKYEPVKPISITNLVYGLLIKSGIRKVNREGKGKGFRHDTQIDHAFRKWFVSQCVNADINDTKRELLTGHELPRNDPNHVRVKKELLSEYLKVVDLLTINQTLILKEENKKLVEEKNEITMMELRHKKDMQLVLEEHRKTKEENSAIKKKLEKLRQQSTDDLKQLEEELPNRVLDKFLKQLGKNGTDFLQWLKENDKRNELEKEKILVKDNNLDYEITPMTLDKQEVYVKSKKNGRIKVTRVRKEKQTLEQAPLLLAEAHYV